MEIRFGAVASPGRLRGRIAAGILGLAALTGPAGAAVPEIGTLLHDRLELAGKQVPLPAGDWLVAGTAIDAVSLDRWTPATEVQSVALLKVQDGAVAGAVLVHANSRSVPVGWGKTRLCSRADLPMARIHAESDHDVSCSFVAPVARDADPEAVAPAWRQARRLAEAKGWRLPGTWLMAGYRVADLRDVLDARYHFNPDVLAPSIPADPATAWSASPWIPEHIALDPARTAVIAALAGWTPGLQEPVELGFRNRMPADASIAMPMLEVRSEATAAAPAGTPSYVQPDALSLSFWKTVTYRVLASATDLGVNYLFTGNFALSSSITAAGVFAFSGVYFLHESAWNLFGITTTVREVEFPGLGRDG
jgi:uncharacterized membrane protein